MLDLMAEVKEVRFFGVGNEARVICIVALADARNPENQYMKQYLEIPAGTLEVGQKVLVRLIPESKSLIGFPVDKTDAFEAKVDKSRLRPQEVVNDRITTR